jgi:hypothetical protein
MLGRKLLRGALRVLLADKIKALCRPQVAAIPLISKISSHFIKNLTEVWKPLASSQGRKNDTVGFSPQ